MRPSRGSLTHPDVFADLVVGMGPESHLHIRAADCQKVIRHAMSPSGSNRVQVYCTHINSDCPRQCSYVPNILEISIIFLSHEMVPTDGNDPSPPPYQRGIQPLKLCGHNGALRGYDPAFLRWCLSVLHRRSVHIGVLCGIRYHISQK